MVLWMEKTISHHFQTTVETIVCWHLHSGLIPGFLKGVQHRKHPQKLQVIPLENQLLANTSATPVDLQGLVRLWGCLSREPLKPWFPFGFPDKNQAQEGDQARSPTPPVDWRGPLWSTANSAESIPAATWLGAVVHPEEAKRMPFPCSHLPDCR